MKFRTLSRSYHVACHTQCGPTHMWARNSREESTTLGYAIKGQQYERELERRPTIQLLHNITKFSTSITALHMGNTESVVLRGDLRSINCLWQCKYITTTDTTYSSSNGLTLESLAIHRVFNRVSKSWVIPLPSRIINNARKQPWISSNTNQRHVTSTRLAMTHS